MVEILIACVVGFLAGRYTRRRKIEDPIRMRIAAQTRKAIDAGHSMNRLVNAALKRTGYNPDKVQPLVRTALTDMLLGHPTAYANELAYLRLLDGWDMATELFLLEYDEEDS